MALYRITTTRSYNAGMRGSIDPGMSVEMSSMIPIMLAGPYLDKINQLFINKYGVDLRGINVLNGAYLTVTKIS